MGIPGLELKQVAVRLGAFMPDCFIDTQFQELAQLEMEMDSLRILVNASFDSSVLRVRRGEVHMMALNPPSTFPALGATYMRKAGKRLYRVPHLCGMGPFAIRGFFVICNRLRTILKFLVLASHRFFLGKGLGLYVVAACAVFQQPSSV